MSLCDELKFTGKKHEKCPTCGKDLIWCEVHIEYHHADYYVEECRAGFGGK